MRKVRLLALLLLLPLLLCACGGQGTAHTYDDPDHAHVFGNRYDVIATTCLEAGVVVRYCKICHASVTEKTEVPADIALRAHAFSDTVVPPTEATEGYTARACTRCSYTVDRAFVVPAKYALLTAQGTLTAAPTGVDALAVSDTLTHLLSYDVARDTAVPAEVACRMAVALTVVDELTREGAVLTENTEIAFGGGSFPLKRLLFAWLEEGDAAVARAFATVIGGSEDAFSLRVAARMARLGVADAVTVNPFSPQTGSATLGATAVLTARVLDEPLLLQGFADAVGLVLVAGKSPALYLASADGTLRVSALSLDGTLYFAAVYGSLLPADAEASLYPIP